MLRQIREMAQAGRYDFYLLRNFGVDSVKKQRKIRAYHKCPPKCVMDNMHIVPQEILEKQKNKKFKVSPKISIITPLYNTPKQFLEEMLDSVQEQTYPNWELCLADGSTDSYEYVGKICKARAKKDHRIVYCKLEKNEGTSENTNTCIKMSTGEFIGLLDHDDRLHPSALFEAVKAINKENADFIYTDAVQFGEKIETINNPIFFNLKPGFSKYDLRAHNYICHFTVFSKHLLDEGELYRKEYDGSQDHDMVLRMTEKAERIVHIPKVLYYWRLHSNSVSMDLDTKAYAIDAAFKAVKSQLERNHISGSISNTKRLRTLYRINYDIIDQPKVSIIIHGTANGEDVEEVIDRLLKNTDYRPLEILYAKKENVALDYENVSLVNMGDICEMKKTEIWNHGAELATGTHIVLLDRSVCPLSSGWIEEMLMYSQKEDVHAVAPKIFYKDWSIAYAGVSLREESKTKIRILGQHNVRGDDGYEALLRHVRKTASAFAACMMFSKKCWEEVGGFSDQCPGYEDIDFCVKGLEEEKYNIWTCFAVLSCEKKEICEEKTDEQAQIFENRHGTAICNDETFHPGWDILHLI